MLVGTRERNLVGSRRLFEVVEGELVGENALSCGWEGVKEYLWESDLEWSRKGVIDFLECRGSDGFPLDEVRSLSFDAQKRATCLGLGRMGLSSFVAKRGW